VGYFRKRMNANYLKKYNLKIKIYKQYFVSDRPIVKCVITNFYRAACNADAVL